MKVANRATRPPASSASEDPSLSRNGSHSPLAVRAHGFDGLSRDDWIDKLKDSRCKWMVILRRYNSGNNSSSKTDSLGKLRLEDARRTGPHTRFRIDKSLRANDSGVVPAADFCRSCASIVEVKLEYVRNGDVVEHRGPCSVCESNEHPSSWLASDKEEDTLGSLWAASPDHHDGRNRSLPIEKVIMIAMYRCIT